jgi:hypothetical protein
MKGISFGMLIAIFFALILAIFIVIIFAGIINMNFFFNLINLIKNLTINVISSLLFP